jgi:hypothetical protein
MYLLIKIIKKVYSLYPEIHDLGQLGLGPPLVNDVAHTKLYAGYECLILEILLER